MNNSKIEIARKWFEELRDKLILNIEKIDSTNFIITEWDHKHQGGGKMSKIKGQVIEKGGVNISTVEGKFEENMIGKVPGTENDSSYQATGISVVLHPHSPFIPSMHFNTRFLKTEQEWFGGGIDVTPCLPFKDEEQYHSSLESLCDKFDKNYYKKFKSWCDEYFYLPHRKEARGIGGIFFDYKMNNWEKDFLFVKDVGITFADLVKKIIRKKMFLKSTKKDKHFQLMKRGRYVEFNLLYDRGTKFGLNSGGNPKAILMSMPPNAKWK